MSIQDFANYLLVDPASEVMDGYRPWYVAFNFCEAACWLGFSLVVLVRHLRFRKTLFEGMYAFAFLLFAFSDVIETTGTTVVLVLFKVACLIAILALRKIVLHHYPSWRF